MMLVVQLKSIPNVAKLLVSVEEDGKELKHTDGVLFSPPVIDVLRGMETLEVVAFHKYNSKYAVGIKKADGVVTYISPLWLKSISDGSITVKPTTCDTGNMKAYLEFGDMLLNMDTTTLIKREDLKVCGCCGAVIEEDVMLNKVKLCRSCFLDKNFNVKNYSYKPEPEFTGSQIKADIENPIWYGVELEYGLNDKMSLAKAIHGEAIYLKSDSSIESGTDGRAEMVTHPHSFNAIMDKDSWASKLDTIDANSSVRNGCHVHVSRTAFADDKHYALAYYLLYEMGQQDGSELSMLETLGGRAFTNYCQRDVPSDRIHRLTKDGAKSKNRTSWLNENCEHTIEFRFFGGTNKGDELKRYVQLLDATIKYTKYHKKSVSIAGLVSYINKYAKKYAQLDTFLKGNADIISTKVVTFVEPSRKGFEAAILPYALITDIVSITKTSGTVYSNVSEAFVEGSTLYFRHKGNREEVSFIKVASVIVEV